MSTPTSTPASTVTPATEQSSVPSSGTTFPNVVRSEWTKLWSVRSTRWTLLATISVSLAFTTLFAWGQTANWSQVDAQERANFDATSNSLGGLYFGQLAIAVLGALVITAEYSTGGIRTTLTAVPQRLKVLLAKGLTFAVVAVVVGVLTSFAAFFIGQAFFATKGVEAHLADPGVLRAVVGGGLYILGCGMLGFAVGSLLRHSAGAITTAVGLLFVLPLLSNLLPGDWGKTVREYFFSNAGGQITTVRQDPNLLAPWNGYLVFSIEWLAILIAGAILLRRRDA
jgi:ABC-2 type transport system permease protein